MVFSPFNKVIKLCIQGMSMEDNNKPEEALQLFDQAWDQATDDVEKFLAAYYVARQQKSNENRLKWLQSALAFAIKSNDAAVKSAFPSLYLSIAKCYDDSGDPQKAKKNYDLAASFQHDPSDKGPFYHGTKADLQVGSLLIPGVTSNYDPELKMNHIYFTALVNVAGLAAGLAKGSGNERVYIVEPAGSFENDPNVTDKKFPGNLTRSYRSLSPLKIIGEVTDWDKTTPDEFGKWREKVDHNKGEIIN